MLQGDAPALPPRPPPAAPPKDRRGASGAAHPGGPSAARGVIHAAAPPSQRHGRPARRPGPREEGARGGAGQEEGAGERAGKEEGTTRRTDNRLLHGLPLLSPSPSLLADGPPQSRPQDHGEAPTAKAARTETAQAATEGRAAQEAARAREEPHLVPASGVEGPMVVTFDDDTDDEDEGGDANA